MSQQPKVAADSDRAQVLSVCSAVQCAVASAVPRIGVGSDNPDRLDCPVETRSPTSTAEAFLRRTTRLGSGTSVGASVQRISASQKRVSASQLFGTRLGNDEGCGQSVVKAGEPANHSFRRTCHHAH